MTTVGGAVAELGDQLERGVGIVEIVVAEFLALDLLGLGDARGVRADRQVERRLLVRILAVAQRHLEPAREGPALREALPLVGEGEPLRDRSHHRRRSARRPWPPGACGSRATSRRRWRRARRAARHNRPGSVTIATKAWFLAAERTIDGPPMSIFSMISSRSAPLITVCGERVEIDHDQVDRRDAVLGHRRGMLGIVAHAEQAAMDLGVERLDPPVHHFGKAGEVADVADLERRARAARRRCRRSRPARRRAAPGRRPARRGRSCRTGKSAPGGPAPGRSSIVLLISSSGGTARRFRRPAPKLRRRSPAGCVGWACAARRRSTGFPRSTASPPRQRKFHGGAPRERRNAPMPSAVSGRLDPRREVEADRDKARTRGSSCGPWAAAGRRRALPCRHCRAAMAALVDQAEAADIAVVAGLEPARIIVLATGR